MYNYNELNIIYNEFKANYLYFGVISFHKKIFVKNIYI
jgi:hypothetical protein